MKLGRDAAMRLSLAALALICFGVAAIAFNSGVPGGTLPSHDAGTSFPASQSAGASSSPTPVPTSTGRTPAPDVPSPSVAVSPSAIPSPTQHPTGFVVSSTGIDYYADDGSVVSVQPVPGLEVRIQSGRAIYYAQTGNKLGLADGSYAGEFMPMVSMGQSDGSSAQTGGIVLAGLAVSRLLSDRLATIQNDADRWMVALPVDIRTSKQQVSVTFDRFGLSGWSNTPRVIVRYGGSLPVVEAVPANGGFNVLVEQLGITTWQVVDPIRLSLAPDSIDATHVMNELLIYGSGKPSMSHDVSLNSRALMGSPMLSATGDVSVSLVVNGSRAELGPDKVLKVGDVPVFVAALGP
jgi:hypothetical protein